ncbi:MAG: ABC transporter permease [Fimbriimonadaceae bacterium]
MARTKTPLFQSLALRIGSGILSLLFVALVTFVAGEMAPGDAALMIAGEKASPEAVARIRTELGLDQPWPARFVRFVGDAAKGEFGRSYFGIKEPVRDVLARALPFTMKLAAFALIVAALLGVGLGALAAVYKDTWIDRLALTIGTLGVTVPNFVLAPILVFVFVIKADMLPVNYDPQLPVAEFYYLILPTLVLAARPMASLSRLTRASLLDALRQDFVRLAIAKGLSPWRVNIVHGLRNAILPVVTSMGSSFGFLLTGSFIVERFFTVPGIGFVGIDAIQKRDTPVLMASVLVTGAMFIIVNLVVDLVLPLLDPRIREATI